MCRYSCFKERKHDNEYGDYITYGILLDGEVAVSDLSLDGVRVRDLVARCNEGNLDPIHLPNVIEDFLGESTEYLTFFTDCDTL